MPAVPPSRRRRTRHAQAQTVTRARRREALRGLRRPRTWVLAGLALLLILSTATVASRFGQSGRDDAWPHSPQSGESPRRSPETDGNFRLDCALPRYPTPTCTGVPAGTKLATLALNVDRDSYAVYRAGAVIDSKHIPGNLLIRAPHVTVRNSQIDGTVFNDYNGRMHPYTIVDSTIGPATGCITAPGLAYANYTARRVQVRGHDDGFRVATPGNVRIEDSYAKLCWNPPELAPPDGSHSGGIQADCRAGECVGVWFNHNTIDNRGPNGNSGITMMSFDGNPVRNVTSNDNLVMGGGYSIIYWWTGGPNFEIHNNRVVKGSYVYAPVDANRTCANQNWSGNTLVTIDARYNVTSTVGRLSCGE